MGSQHKGVIHTLCKILYDQHSSDLAQHIECDNKGRVNSNGNTGELAADFFDVEMVDDVKSGSVPSMQQIATASYSIEIISDKSNLSEVKQNKSNEMNHDLQLDHNKNETVFID